MIRYWIVLSSIYSLFLTFFASAATHGQNTEISSRTVRSSARVYQERGQNSAQSNQAVQPNQPIPPNEINIIIGQMQDATREQAASCSSKPTASKSRFNADLFNQVILHYPNINDQSEVCDPVETFAFLEKYWRYLRNNHGYKKDTPLHIRSSFCGKAPTSVNIPCSLNVLPQGQIAVFPVNAILTSGSFKSMRPGVIFSPGKASGPFHSKLFAELSEPYQGSAQYKKITSELDLLKSLQGEGIVKTPFFELHAPGVVVSYQDHYPGNLTDFAGKRGSIQNSIQNLSTRLLKGLQLVHRKDIVHRDIKPENILYTDEVENGVQKITPFLADFGLARKITDPVNPLHGTPAYIAPEVVRKLCVLDYHEELEPKKLDSWAMGLTIASLVLPDFKIKEKLKKYQPLTAEGNRINPFTANLVGDCMKEPHLKFSDTYKMISWFKEDRDVEALLGLDCHALLSQNASPSYEGLVCGLLKTNSTERWDMEKALEYVKKIEVKKPEVNINSITLKLDH